jgi:hypothetical protein
MLVADRDELARRCAALTDRCRELLGPLARDCPHEVDYLLRQIGFTGGFYRFADFWGGL